MHDFSQADVNKTRQYFRNHFRVLYVITFVLSHFIHCHITTHSYSDTNPIRIWKQG